MKHRTILLKPTNWSKETRSCNISQSKAMWRLLPRSDRRKGESIINRYEKLYRSNKDFREYVDRYMRNKEDVKLKDVLRMKQICLVGDMYESEGK